MGKYEKAIIVLMRVYDSLNCCSVFLNCKDCYYLKFGCNCMSKLHNDMLIILRGLYGCNNNSKERGRSNES